MKRTGLSSILKATRSENAALQHSIVENLRLVMLNFIAETLEQEVQSLCGHMHSRKLGHAHGVALAYAQLALYDYLRHTGATSHTRGAS